jgi:hypothetical protein
MFAAGAVNAMRRDHVLGQIDTDSNDLALCDLLHGLPLFQLQIDDSTPPILALRRRGRFVGSPF